MPETETLYCSDIARDHGVPLAGSATHGDVWFLVEYSSRWETKAVEMSDIPEEVRSALMSIESPKVEPRILLIQQAESRQREGIHFFVGQTDPKSPRLYEYVLQDYRDILEIDLTPFAAGQLGDPTHLREEPLFLVCTNGRRDLCCARFGPEVYREMRKVLGDAVWQSSHIGGHNKAPVMLFFPFGVNYGRATPWQAVHLAQEFKQGLVGLDNLRGRVCYSPHVQAAEHFWRQETGVLDLPGMEVVSEEYDGDHIWRIGIQGVDGEHRVEIGVRLQDSAYEIPVTCKPGKTATVDVFHRTG